MMDIVPVAERPFEDLVAQNAPVIHRTIASYANQIDGFPYDDLRQEMLLVMWECQRRFRWGGEGGQKGHDRQFFYYLLQTMYNRMRKLHRRATRVKRTATLVSYDAPQAQGDGGDGYLDLVVDTHELRPDTHAILASLSPMAKMYVECRIAGIPVSRAMSKQDAQRARTELNETFRSD